MYRNLAVDFTGVQSHYAAIFIKACHGYIRKYMHQFKQFEPISLGDELDMLYDLLVEVRPAFTFAAKTLDPQENDE